LARSVLAECFSATDIDRVSNLTSAHDQFAGLRNLYVGNTRQGLAAEHWTREWYTLRGMPTQTPSEVAQFYGRVVELAEEYQRIHTGDVDRKHLLTHLVSLFVSRCPDHTEFAHLKMTVTGPDGSSAFEPPLVQPPGPVAAGQAQPPPAPGPNHWTTAVRTFINRFTDAYHNYQSAHPGGKGGRRQAHGNEAKEGGKWCTFHKVSTHDSSECRRLKDGTESGGKGKVSPKGKAKVTKEGANSCKFCGKAHSKPNDCK
ncbi:hypothetical protein HDU96_002703, partial [Phlyctochytrium bullatum]